MAETNDLSAHYRSINPQPNSISLLNGRRYGNRYSFQTNQAYNIPSSKWEAVKDSPDKFQKLVKWYVSDHFDNQLPRILELERYYLADNNIHYWLSHKKSNRADNRISSALARYITNIQVGYEFGTPLTFGYQNKDNDNDTGDNIMQVLDDFNQSNDEPYHEKIMGKNLANVGRAYELLYVPQNSKQPKITAIDPNSAFVVWSTDVEPVELFAVRYYVVNVADETYYQVEVYTDNHIYYFNCKDNPDSDWTLDHSDEHFFKEVPLIEYRLNEERVGAWETKLDELDAYDQALSEMANSQEDFSNATLMVNGKVANNSGKTEQMLDPKGQPVYLDNTHGGYTNQSTTNGKPNAPVMVQKVLDTKANVLYLKPYIHQNPNGTPSISNTSAGYLTKSLDANEWQIYIQQLLSDIHKDTNTPDTTDQNFAANASGVAMAYKLWGSDQEMAMSETLYQRGIRRRLELLAIYWSYLSNTGVKVTDDSNPADNVTITFTPNLPKNNQETMTLIQGLNQTGKFSAQTLRELAEPITGIPADQEKERSDDEGSQQDDRTATLIANAQANAQKMNNGSGDDDGNDQAGT
ncbi:phage portal protein [Lentilactobacillus fungorum]|uniref:Phage portal protein n=1 Tax=Lentilactobacillus fungorum TaxID=2201250 RepID=A0ABQ3VYC0_9LACO|nr:phage portal protein [Lentilactobacillus fungorum]GHP12986.1 phage portal protein [Lentilactobacillus fungorum]